MDTDPVTTSVDESAAKPAAPIWRRRRDILLIGGGAALALVIALVAGVPFASSSNEEKEHAAEPAADAGHEAFPPKLEDEVTEAAKTEKSTGAPVAEEHAPVVAHAEPLQHAQPAAAQAATAHAETVSAELKVVGLAGLAKDWQRALELEVKGDAAGAVSTFRAAVASLPGQHASVRRLALLALGAMEARRGESAKALRAFADAEAACAALDGAELIAFGKACLEAGAPRLARMAAARTSLVARSAAAADPALVLSVTRLHAEALDAEWRQSHGAFVLPEPALRFEGAAR